MGVHRKAKKSAPKTTARQQSVIKARLKLLTQNFFSAKVIYKCMIDDESYFTVDGNAWQQQSYNKSVDHPATEDVKFIRNTKFPAKVLLLAVSESDISEPMFFKAGLVPVLHKFIQKHHKNKKDTLVRLEELKLNTSQRNKIQQTPHRCSRSKIFGRT
jgi:hypothetical protein